MLALPDAEKRFDFSSVRVCVSAGESLPADVLLRWKEKFNVDILDGMGALKSCTYLSVTGLVTSSQAARAKLCRAMRR